MTIEWTKVNNNHKNKKEIFLKLRNQIFYQDTLVGGIKLSSLKNDEIIEEIKSLKVIELNNFERLHSYINYDHYLMFKFKDEYYFCDADLYPGIGNECLIKIIDYNQYLRKDKINKINENTI